MVRKSIYILLCVLIMTGCASYRSLDLSRLTTGMSKGEVERIAGLPDRILAVNETNDGYQEVLEYRTTRGDIYALEFWNDYLTGYEYLYEDVQYIPAPYPPAIMPPYGRPIYVYPGNVNRPGYNRPGYQNRPNVNNNNRPDNTNRPNTDNSGTVTRPVENRQSSGESNQSGSSSRSRDTNTNTNTNSRTNRTN